MPRKPMSEDQKIHLRGLWLKREKAERERGLAAIRELRARAAEIQKDTNKKYSECFKQAQNERLQRENEKLRGG